MTTATVKPTDFRIIWTNALSDFYRSTNVDLIEDRTIFHPTDVDDLIGHLKKEHLEFANDTRSSKFTNVIKGAIGPLNFLTATAGSSAAQMFPGGSQVLAAFGVLVNAGAAVTKSFDAVGGLFAKLGSFTSRLKEVSIETIPDALVPIYQAILVSLLSVCALAVRMSFRTLKDEKPGHGRFREMLKRIAQPVFQNVDEYTKQLMGGNSEVRTAVETLETLVHNESLMMQAILVRKATEIRAIAVDIQGLTVRWSKAAYNLQADTAELKVRMTLVGQSLEGIQGSQIEIRENTSDIKTIAIDTRKAQVQHSTAIEAIDKKLSALMEKSGSNKQREVAEKSKAAVSSESKLWKKLEATLGVKSVRTTNESTYERVSKERIKGTAEWITKSNEVQEWLSGEAPFLIVSGDGGHGKTFLASRIIDQITDLCKPGAHGSDKAMAYFFCRKGQAESQNVSLALKTMAYEIARTDTLYAKYLTDVLESDKLSKNDNISPPFVREESSDDAAASSTPRSAEEPSAAIASVGGASIDANDDTAYESGTPLAEPAEDPMLSQMLRRVNTAVTERQALNDEDEENTVRPVHRHWEILFGKFYAGVAKHVYLVVDGLDECNEAEAFALCAAVNESFVATDCKSTVHMILLMSTRRAQLITRLFPESRVLQIRKETNTPDLSLFLEKRLQFGWQKKLVEPKLRDEAKKAVLEGCDGNFLKASLIADEIVSLSREDVVRLFLRNLPATIESAMLLVFDRLSRQLERHNLEDLHDMFAFVACARRDLSLAELDAMLTMRRPLGARVVDLEIRLRGSFAILFTVNGEVAPDHSLEDERVRRRLTLISSASAAVNCTTQKTVPASNDDDGVALRKTTASMRMHRNYVSLSHTLIVEQIQKRAAETGVISFTTDSMQATVLLRCLETLCGTNGPFNEQTSRLSGSYAGLYLTEHVAAVQPGKVEPATRLGIAKLFIQLFREPSCLVRWIGFAEGYLTDDLSNTAFHESVVKWLLDEEVQAGVDAAEAQWIQQCDLAKAPFVTLFRDLALAVAHRWLTQVTGQTEDYLRFLQMYQDVAEASNTGDTQIRQKSDELSSLPTKEIFRIAEWAELEKDGRWHSRVGYLLRSLNRNGEALQQYQKAVLLDPHDANIRAGLGVTFAALEKFEDAARETCASIDLFATALEQGVPSPDPDYSVASSLMTTRQELAGYYVKIGKVDDALQQYTMAIEDFESFDPTAEDWNEMLSIVVAYYQTLTNNKRWNDAHNLLQRFLSHPQRHSEDFTIYWYIAFDESALLRIGYNRKDVDVLLAFNDNALSVIARYAPETQVTLLVYTRAMLLLRLNEDRTDEAINLLKLVTQDDEVDDWTKDRADREIARHYLNQILEAREEDEWAKVGHFAESLVSLVTDEKDVHGNRMFGTRDCSLVLAAWDRMNSRMNRAKECTRTRVTLGIDMLCDTDPDNDILSWMYLSDAFLAIGDRRLAVAATDMLRQSRFLDSVVADASDHDHAPDSAAKEMMDTDVQAGASREPADALPQNSDGVKSPITASEGMDSQEPVDHIASTTVPIRPVSAEAHSQADSQAETQAHRTINTSGSFDTKELTTEQVTPGQGEVATRPGDPFYYCDGNCFEEIANDALMWRCSLCIADFCDDCHKRIMERDMDGWNICGDTHDHVEIPGAPTKYPKDIIRVDAEEVKVSDFVETLRKEWNYPVKEAATISQEDVELGPISASGFPHTSEPMSEGT